MKIEKTFLRSKVAQRIAFLFILCALLPIVTLAMLSINQVTKHLREQSLTRLRQTNKTTSMAIYERLLFLEADMIRMAFRLNEITQGSTALPFSNNDYQKDRFKGFVVLSDSGESVPLFGNLSSIPHYTQEEKNFMLRGETLLTTHFLDDQTPQILLSRAVNPNSDPQNFLLAEVEPFYLWYMGYETALPALTEFFILDHENNVLFSTPPFSPRLAEQISGQILSSSSDQFDWSHNGKNYLASFRDMFLQPKFLTSHWTVIASESKAYIHTPVASFKNTFFLIILLSLWVVIFLSFSQIRRSLIPLEKLKAGVRRIAKRDFSTKVVITSQDEFADLAKTFNTMAYQLGRQFKTLTTIAEIDRAILSAFNAKEIVTSLLTRITDAFPCDTVGVTLLEKNNPNKGIIYTEKDDSVTQKNKGSLILSDQEIRELSDHQENMVLNQEKFSQSYLTPLVQNGIKSFHIFPIFLRNTLAGIISFGYKTKPDLTKEDLSQARQLSDQVGVALSNARLIEELSDFNWSTLIALARAIDAKSPWTAGHSEKVTEYGLEIGKEMGFSKEDMDILQRGGLLHDIGKLGIPNKILDKPGKLTEEEKQIIQKHPSLGARILEPISAYTDTMHIVLQHHENYDGTGYPDGLAGEEISIYSRILAIADRFEAMTAGRPYRKGLPPGEAAKFIQKYSGTQFDPALVDAFLRSLTKKRKIHLSTKDNISLEYSTRSQK
ncbi:MAG: HD domain-containing protein [Candidatus Aminicenantes bacterium]|nr:MAG: HD domain-containing protein [Candidatus Aminicenantes bacterium]